MNAENQSAPLFPSRLSLGRNVLWIASVALIYFVAARLSLLLEFQPEGIAAIWPPEGVFLSAILLTRRDLRFYLVGTLWIADLLAERLAGTPFVVSTLYALTLAGNASLSSWLLLRFVGSQITFTKVREVFGFLTLAVILSNSLWSLLAAAASDLLPGTISFWNSWKWWAASDGIGNLLGTPFILSWAYWARSGWGTWNRKRVIESAALFIPLALLNFVAFSYLSKSGLFSLLLPYVTFPFLLWAALRFGVRGVTSALVILAAIAVSFAAAGPIPAFPFYGSRLTAVIVVQLYLAVLAVPSLFLVAVVTERQRAEEALRESEERYRILLEHGFDGIFVHEDYRIVQLNDRLAEMAGYTRAELIGSNAIDLFLPESQERIRQYIRSGATGPFEIELRRRDGPIVGVESYGAPCQFHGRRARIVGLRDITERKRAQEALRESEERFRTAFEEGAVAMALTALDSTLLKVNSSFCRMLGFSESELVGRSYVEITHPDDRAANLVGTRRLACGAISSFRMEKRYIRKDGAVIWVDMSTASVHDANGRPLYCVTHVQDITERKQAEEVLRRLNGQLELEVAQRTEDLRHTVGRLRELTLELSQAEDRERKRIADILHEDVQQTLAAARFHLNLLASKTYSAEESRRIVWQVRQMLRDAIERSRSLSHELSPAIYQVGLTEILEWLARHMQQEHGLTVRVEAHGPVDSRSEPLKAFLYKVTQELLFNVIKHAGVREARVRVRRMGQCLYLSVVDRGRGFDPQKLEGTAGFGLLSIRERIQLLGGRMKIRSRPGTGSRLLIAIPDPRTSEVAVPAENGEGQAQPEMSAQRQRAAEP